MKNKSILVILILFISSCSMNKVAQNPLILPPAFEELPDPENPDKSHTKSNDKDLEYLKELLLEN